MSDSVSVERGSPQITYTEDVYESDRDVKQYNDPDGCVYRIVEEISFMHNKQRHVL